jgi:carbonic anhydrase
MAVIAEFIKAKEVYAKNFTHGKLPLPPAKKLAMVACMDAPLVLSQILGTGIGDIPMIRNAGGIAIEYSLLSFIISLYLLGKREFVIINHADFEMLTFKSCDLLAWLQNETGTAAFAPNHFHALGNFE